MRRAPASFSARPSRSTARATTPSSPSARTAPRWLRQPFGLAPTPAPFRAARRALSRSLWRRSSLPFRAPFSAVPCGVSRALSPRSRTHREPSTDPAASLRRSRARLSQKTSLDAGAAFAPARPLHSLPRAILGAIPRAVRRALCRPFRAPFRAPAWEARHSTPGEKIAPRKAPGALCIRFRESVSK